MSLFSSCRSSPTPTLITAQHVSLDVVSLEKDPGLRRLEPTVRTGCPVFLEDSIFGSLLNVSSLGVLNLARTKSGRPSCDEGRIVGGPDATPLARSDVTGAPWHQDASGAPLPIRRSGFAAVPKLPWARTTLARNLDLWLGPLMDGKDSTL